MWLESRPNAYEKCLLPRVQSVEASLEALSFKASFLKRPCKNKDFRSLLLSSENILGNIQHSHPSQPLNTFNRFASRNILERRRLYFLLLLLVAIALSLVIYLNLIVLQHSKMPATTTGSPILSPNSIIPPLPPRESFTPSEYRSNWTNYNSSVLPVGFDIVGPLDLRNGRGLGWTVFFIHGLGAINASDSFQWRDFLLSSYTDPTQGSSYGDFSGLKFIFPKAPIRNITVYDSQSNHGERPGWFDIKDWRDLHYLEDEEGLRQSVIGLSSILKNQTLAGRIQMNQTIIAGFSQGQLSSL